MVKEKASITRKDVIKNIRQPHVIQITEHVALASYPYEIMTFKQLSDETGDSVVYLHQLKSKKDEHGEPRLTVVNLFPSKNPGKINNGLQFVVRDYKCERLIEQRRLKNEKV